MELTKEEFKEFKKLYNKAVKEEKTQFTFKDQPVLVAYAKYVIEYLNTLKKK
jgi:hypothetical protein